MFTFMYMWWFWLVLALVVFLPTGYGWGYRGWGAPYPSYLQRRRMQIAMNAGSSRGFDHLAWGRGGDFIWALVLFDVVFFGALFLWR
jgi:hypothetical protein